MAASRRAERSQLASAAVAHVKSFLIYYVSLVKGDMKTRRTGGFCKHSKTAPDGRPGNLRKGWLFY